MKATVKQFAAATLVALLLVAVNVKAEGKETIFNNSENSESTLSLEKWMTDEAIWNTDFMNITDFQQETEPAFHFDDWMFNHEIWNTCSANTDEVETS